MRNHRLLSLAAGAGLALSAMATVLALGPQLRDPIPEHIPPSDLTVALRPVATGMNSPVRGTFAPHDKKTLYVIDQTGPIWAIDVSDDRATNPPKRLFADLTPFVTPLGCFIGYDERGLLGIAFHPDYAKNGLLYTYASETGTGTGGCTGQASTAAPPNHQSVLREWRVTEPKSNSATVDASSSRVVMRIDQPQFNHNGGDIAFGPDGMLYIATGDGGSADDQGVAHEPGGNAQFLGNLLGKVLRIDVDDRTGSLGYGVPLDNPFVAIPAARAEIWAYGFRNPYRMSFDRKTGALWAGEVGQNDIEEVDIVTRGGNYGWPVKEGSFVFNNNGAGPGFVTGDASPPGLIDPVAEYDHWLDETRSAGVTEGIAIVGGFVYRGTDINDQRVRGHYIFGDYARRFASATGRLFILDEADNVTELQIQDQSGLGLAVTGFAEDSNGEIYVLGNRTGLVGGAAFPAVPTNTGVVLKLARAK